MKFRLEKKLVVKIRYYEHLYFIRDEDGETLFAGSDEDRAREVLTILIAYHNKKAKHGKAKPVRKAPKNRNRQAGKKSSRR